ncbi:L-2-hydroxyglutarate oxidase [Arthrobacter parietis]|uniref:L-2-hydroxyglutarate oxidase n=1 Tax=Arthrobacter parietis TaxID=271434 RepID=A0ABN3AQ95_9MICC
MTATRYAVIGGGILGTAVARRLLQQQPDASVTVLEKEDSLAAHQTGRNSGVVHAGLYYTPGSLKAKLCRRGVELLKEYCASKDLAYDEIGKVLVARDAVEESRLGDIMTRAQANGVPGVRIINRAELRELEPHVEGVGGLHSPHTAIVDYGAVTRSFAEDVVAAGGTVHTGFEVTGITQRGKETLVTGTHNGTDTWEIFDSVIICAGLQADRVAGLAGDREDPKIVPFRGEYYLLKPSKRSLVRGLVYPVPDPRYPFLGVHLTPRTDGEVMVGPNAVLALAREAYGWGTVSPRDLGDAVGYPGFRAFAKQHWKTGAVEMVGSLNKRRFVNEARKYVPELTVDDVVPGPSGIRAQALDRDGSLVDDFRISHHGSVLAVRNAPSPAATSSLAIAEHIVSIVLDSDSKEVA